MIQYKTVPAGYSSATILPTMDFETYSEAGYDWDEGGQRWVRLRGAAKRGIHAVGTVAYAAHPSTEVIMLWFDLKDGAGRQYWAPGMPNPVHLFDHFARGGLMEATNSAFELNIWNRVCVRRYGWPPLAVESLRDVAAKARAWGLPGSLEGIGEVLNIADKKDSEGDRLIKKFSVPRNPTKNNPATRILMSDDLEDATRFIAYGERDVLAESQASELIPDLPPEELDFWLMDQRSNWRGMAVDVETIDAGATILEAALDRYNAELVTLTGGVVQRASEVEKLIGWLGAHGVHTNSLAQENVEELLARDDLPPVGRRALELRQLIASASVKKLFALQRQVVDGRARNMFIYHRARTGRDGGADIQPQNLPKAGPMVRQCGDMNCQRWYGEHLSACPYCHAGSEFSTTHRWGHEAVSDAVEAIRSGSLDYVEYMFGDALLTLSGCIRGMFVAAPGHDLICSDYSSIEAVVTAMLAGEQWRIDAFHRGDDIYLRSASMITGTPFEQYTREHPDRDNLGKPAELGLGFGGWVGAWYQFDNSGRFSEEEIKRFILRWRAASPAVVELWGGQVRGKPWAPTRRELYGLEGAAISAIQNPGQCFRYRMIAYQVHQDVLYAQLPSGRLLAYHRPRLSPSTRWPDQLGITFEGFNTNPKNGPMGWHRMHTYGGRLTENVVQATARDIMRDAAVRIEAAGYPIVLRVHDELVAEVPKGFGSVEEFEQLMGIRPAWAADWPVRAAGGWRGYRYRKD